MANKFMPKINKSRKVEKRVVASVWLLMALAMGGVVFLLWSVTLTIQPETETPIEAESSVEVDTFNIGQVKEIDDLHELDEAVEPVSFDGLVRDLRNYPPEFKDAKYFKKHKDKWTVQVMDVSESDIITGYLDGRKDRNKFAYFRYRDDNNQPRYILTYDIIPTPQMAMGTVKTVQFDLPSNVRVLPEEINHYITIIESYELSLPVRDLANNRARKVRLQPTKKEIAAKRRPNKDRALEARGDDENSSDNVATSQSSNSSSTPTEEEVVKKSGDASDSTSAPQTNQVTTPDNKANQATSNDISDTTAKPVTGPKTTGASNDNSSNASAQSSDSKSQSKTPAKPSVSTPTLPAANRTDDAQQDSIRQLIEEKTQ